MKTLTPAERMHRLPEEHYFPIAIVPSPTGKSLAWITEGDLWTWCMHFREGRFIGDEGTMETRFGDRKVSDARMHEDGILEVNIEGEGMGVIIGKRGATLDSLQYLATLVVNKGRGDHVRMKLDTEGYRARRQETLEKLAINLAKKAKRTGRRVALEPMNPYERRIIHSVLQADRGVETYSEGEEPYRKVVITPRRKR